MDMKKILQAMDGVKANAEVNSSDMKTFLTIVEGKGPLNRPTAAESIAMQHYAEPVKKTITAPVLNVAEGATPSMIGKYFKTVEQELKEAAERPNKRATQLAKRVIERVVGGEETPPGINRLTGKPIEPQPEPTAAPAGPSLSSRYGPGYEGSPAAYTITVSGKDYKFAGRDKTGPGTGAIVKVPGGAVGIRGLAPVSVELGNDGMFYPAPTAPIQEQFIPEDLKELLDLRNKVEEAIKQRLDPKCWKGKHKEGTKIKGGVRVNNCVPNESIEESKDRCMQCGMTGCTCSPGKCKCKPIAGWIPNKGFKKAVDEAANAAQQAAIAIAKKKAGKK